MSEFILKTGSPSKRVQLSREELLAGKCFPTEIGDSSLDPRLRSPDEFLAQHARDVSKTIDSGAVETTLADLQLRYETEIKAWREYERKVQEWKKEIADILEQFKNAAREKQVVVQELMRAKEKLQQQEQELLWYRQQMTIPNASTF